MNVHVRKSYHAPDMWKKQSLMNQGKKLVTKYFGQMFQHDKTMFDDCLPGFFKRLSLSTKTGPLKKYFEWEWAPEKNNGPTASELALVSTRTCLWKRSIRFSSISVKGKTNKRLDNCQLNLFKYVRDDTFRCLIKLTMKKLQHA